MRPASTSFTHRGVPRFSLPCHQQLSCLPAELSMNCMKRVIRPAIRRREWQNSVVMCVPAPDVRVALTRQCPARESGRAPGSTTGREWRTCACRRARRWPVASGKLSEVLMAAILDSDATRTDITQSTASQNALNFA